MIVRINELCGTTGLLSAVAILTLLLVACEDDSTCPEDPRPDLEVHEWGVMVGCESDTSFFLTSRPEISAQVDIPVIYVHSQSRTPFTAKVSFATGQPTATYPQAMVTGASATWTDVGYADSLGNATDAPGDFVPLEAIIPTLNDVDANILEYNDVRSRFLFYEGEAKFSNEVEVSYDLDSSLATITNHADYAVYDLLLVIMNPSWFQVSDVAKLDELAAGETVSLPLDNQIDPFSLKPQLVELGFTESEAESFDELWRPVFVYPRLEAGPANLAYRLPQSEYDKFISLEITPQPLTVVRALYVLMHLGP